MKVLLRIWDLIEISIIAILGLFATFLGFIAILLRYIFHSPIGWAEEIIILCITWTLLISISRVTVDNQHINVDIVVMRLSPKIKKALDILTSCLCLLFCIITIWYSVPWIKQTLVLKLSTTSSLSFPKWIAFLCIPVGFCLMGLRIIQRFLYSWTQNSHGQKDHP